VWNGGYGQVPMEPISPRTQQDNSLCASDLLPLAFVYFPLDTLLIISMYMLAALIFALTISWLVTRCAVPVHARDSNSVAPT
jgi:hypothetical protein